MNNQASGGESLNYTVGRERADSEQKGTPQNGENVEIQGAVTNGDSGISAGFLNGQLENVQDLGTVANLHLPPPAEVRHADVQEGRQEEERPFHNLQGLFDDEQWPANMQLLDEVEQWYYNVVLRTEDVDQRNEMTRVYEIVRELTIDLVRNHIYERYGPN